MPVLSEPPAIPAVTPFPFLDLKTEFAQVREEVMAAVTRVLETQHFILGPEVESLEKEIANRVDTQFAIGCASGSDALLLSLMALGIGPGDEVITTPFTFVATLGAIARLGATPVLVDINADDFNINTDRVAEAITSKTRAILPVHLFGLAADLGPLLELARKSNVPLVEDAAQALGAKYKAKNVGALGTTGCFSFFPSKNLGGAGDGGMITTNDPGLADRLKILRVHGSRAKYRYECLGINSRLDALQAALLRVKLGHLDEWTALRQRNAQRYAALFAEFGLTSTIQIPTIAGYRVHVFNQYVVRMAERDALRVYLREHGIPTEIYYPHPLHLEQAFKYLEYKPGDFPQAEAACKEVLALPVFPMMTEEQQRYVVSNIANFFSHI
jgi:dTDP-4-amino-4,6-dideoxygalactose transaminase